ncbi:MAG: acyl-CoA dehydrogenase family protein [Pseudomonadota bacterium]
MQFEFTEEQRLIEQMVGGFCAAHGTSDAVRRAMDRREGFLTETWQALAGELGLAGILVPVDHGGQGLGLVELAIVSEQMGRALLPSPFLQSAVLAATLIDRGGTEAQRAAWLPRVATGEVTCAVGVCSRGGAAGVAGVDARLLADGDRLLVEGEWDFVLGAHTADLLLLAARWPDTDGDEGVSVVLLEGDGAGGFPNIERTDHVMLDQTRPASRLAAAGLEVTAAVLGEPGSASGALQAAMDRACLTIAAEQTGAATAALERTVEYVQERKQFGRTVGSFQAVKHRLADMFVLVEAARSAVYYAACNAEDHPATASDMASLAKAQGTETLEFCAGNMIQMHGGIAVTWEHDAHLYFKRARASATLFGNLAAHQERLAVAMGLDSESGEVVF